MSCPAFNISFELEESNRNAPKPEIATFNDEPKTAHVNNLLLAKASSMAERVGLPKLPTLDRR